MTRRMTRKKIFTVNIFIIFVLSMATLNIAFLREDWPFAAYQMYAGLYDGTDFTRFRWVAENRSGDVFELEGTDLHPFDMARLNYCMGNRTHRAERILRQVGLQYETGQAKRGQLKSLKLFETNRITKEQSLLRVVQF